MSVAGEQTVFLPAGPAGLALVCHSILRVTYFFLLVFCLFPPGILFNTKEEYKALRDNEPTQKMCWTSCWKMKLENFMMSRKDGMENS